jgi:hypothetical protein
VADEKLVVNEMLPSALTRAVLASVIPTCCTGGTVGLQDAPGVGVAPPEPEVKPPMLTEGSEPSEEPSVAEGSVVVEESVPAEEPGAAVACPDVEEDLDGAAGPDALAPVLVADPGCVADWPAEVPETDEGEVPAGAPGPGTVPAGVSVLPAEVEPAEVEPAAEPACGLLPLQAVSETASTRSEAVSQRDPAVAAPAPNCLMTVHPPTATPRRNARHRRSRSATRRPQPGIAWRSRAGVVQFFRCLKRRTSGYFVVGPVLSRVRA